MKWLVKLKTKTGHLTVKRRIIKYGSYVWPSAQRSLKPRARYLLLLLLQTQEVASLRG